MCKQPQRLAWTADRPDVTLQILPLDGPQIVCGELSAIPRFVPDGGPASPDVANPGHSLNEFPLDGGSAAGLLRIAPGIPAGAALGPGRSGEVIPKTTESHWSGGQREP